MSNPAAGSGQKRERDDTGSNSSDRHSVRAAGGAAAAAANQPARPVRMLDMLNMDTLGEVLRHLDDQADFLRAARTSKRVYMAGTRRSVQADRELRMSMDPVPVRQYNRATGAVGSVPARSIVPAERVTGNQLVRHVPTRTGVYNNSSGFGADATTWEHVRRQMEQMDRFHRVEFTLGWYLTGHVDYLPATLPLLEQLVIYDQTNDEWYNNPDSGIIRAMLSRAPKLTSLQVNQCVRAASLNKYFDLAYIERGCDNKRAQNRLCQILEFIGQRSGSCINLSWSVMLDDNDIVVTPKLAKRMTEWIAASTLKQMTLYTCHITPAAAEVFRVLVPQCTIITPDAMRISAEQGAVVDVYDTHDKPVYSLKQTSTSPFIGWVYAAEKEYYDSDPED